jgi:hypothetical protein
MEDGATGKGAAPDDGSAERPPTRSFQPSSLGLTVLLPRDAHELRARVTWGDYVTEPPLDDTVFLREAREAAEAGGEKPKWPEGEVDWRRLPREEFVTIPIAASAEPVRRRVPNSATPMARGGGLELLVSCRNTEAGGIDGVKRELLAVSVFLVNARPEPFGRFRDMFSIFQARLQLDFPGGFESRDDRAKYNAGDFDERLSDLHYREVCSCAVGHNTSGDRTIDAERRVTTVFANPLPAQDVEKLGADVDEPGVERDMAKLAAAAGSVATLEPHSASSLSPTPPGHGRKPRSPGPRSLKGPSAVRSRRNAWRASKPRASASRRGSPG